MSTRNRAFWILPFAVFVASLLSVEVAGQRSTKASLRPISAEAKSRALRRLSPELQQHTIVMQRALSRYLALSDAFTPYLSSKHFWLEVRKSRIASRRRSPLDQLFLWDAYAELEKDLLQLMLDDQVGIYQDALELNEV